VPHLPAVSCTMLAGAVGAFVSTLRRIQSRSPEYSAMNPLVETPGLISVVVAPLMGARRR